MLNLCGVLTLEDIEKDETSIIRVSSNIKRNCQSNDLRLMNYYKGMPINFVATVEAVDKGVLEMKVHDLQGVSMHIQRVTFINTSHLPSKAKG